MRTTKEKIRSIVKAKVTSPSDQAEWMNNKEKRTMRKQNHNTLSWSEWIGGWLKLAILSDYHTWNIWFTLANGSVCATQDLGIADQCQQVWDSSYQPFCNSLIKQRRTCWFRHPIATLHTCSWYTIRSSHLHSHKIRPTNHYNFVKVHYPSFHWTFWCENWVTKQTSFSFVDERASEHTSTYQGHDCTIVERLLALYELVPKHLW